jgi:hypothetical protein
VNGKSPYDEQIMSMPSVICNTESVIDIASPERFKSGFYFFFLFNLENYYHFLYDTLPYLYFYKQIQPRPKLLISSGHRFLKFQTEILSLLGIDVSEDCIEAQNGYTYEHLFVPTSLTHGHLQDGEYGSNVPPDKKAYNIWNILSTSVIRPLYVLPRKFYISRRTHLHGDTTNIGTNYTTRRKCINEDDVVAEVVKHGYTEVFCEQLSTNDKLFMFQYATHIIGFIGGGMSNLLFSPASTKVGCIETPDFMRINTRFRYSMDHTQISYLDICSLAPYDGEFPLYTRVEINNDLHPYNKKIGEVYGGSGDECEIHVSREAVAGFTYGSDLDIIHVRTELLRSLDRGLNSPFVCSIEGLRGYLSAEVEYEGDNSNVR